jgi:myo-inositol-1(or 4)-monophosphatase
MDRHRSSPRFTCTERTRRMPASALMTVMMGAARKAARSLVRDFGELEHLQVSVKSPANFVTAADHKAEEILFQELSKARPGYGFVMEERGIVEGPDKSHKWIVDPLDGTTNFLHGNPLFAISVALEREGQLIAGLVYSPIHDEIFTAEKGKGAFLNDRRRLRVAQRKTLADCIVATGIPHRGKAEHGRFFAEASLVMRETAGLRRSGAATIDLTWLAAGRIDAYWEHGLGPWDLAAGIVIVREAGGFAMDAEGGEAMLQKGSIVAGNQQVVKALGELLDTARPAARATAAPKGGDS